MLLCFYGAMFRAAVDGGSMGANMIYLSRYTGAEGVQR